MRWARGVFTLSLDFELAWGSRDLHADPAPLYAAARITRERVFPRLLRLLTERGIVATWATVGHLFLDHAARVDGVLHPDVVPPRHAWHPRPWFDGVPDGDEVSAPELYGRSLVVALRDAGQEVGSHSFSHPIFGDPGLDARGADSDLARCVREAAALGIPLRSFVFPRNSPGHVPLLAKHGFTCWRGVEPAWYLRGPKPVRRLGHLAAVVAATTPPTALPWRDASGLWVLPGTVSILPVDGLRRYIPLRQRERRALAGLHAAERKHELCHLWSHPINLAGNPDGLLGVIERVLDEAARLRDAGRIDILSMGALAERLTLSSPA